MSLTNQNRYRLTDQDEYTHPIEEARNFNESMYLNVFDHAQQIGGWFRIGNRPNEGYAEVSCCLYLPDGKVAFMFSRPKISNNKAFAAAGLKIEVVNPMKALRLEYAGKLCLLSHPEEMASPAKAFASNPHVECSVVLDISSDSPAVGGEEIDGNGNPVEQDPENSFFRGHYEQHIRGRGSFTLMPIAEEEPGPQVLKLDGLGLRDHSWGPRYWQSIEWYRWMPMNFSDEFAVVTSIVTFADKPSEIWALVLQDGVYKSTRQVELDCQYDDKHYPLRYTLKIQLDDQDLQLDAEIISMIPLRNRRTTDTGEHLHTRIIEGFTRFSCNGYTGYGMTEFLDQVIDGVPIGIGV
ncbi:MAG: hypothetical protein AAF431_18210 [Pseudomonadota bacterium]